MFLYPDRDHLDSYRDLTPPHRGRYLLRALRTPEGKMIGNLDLFEIPEEGRWEIAYDLDPDYWGKGLGGMMVDFLVQWAGVIGVKVISAVCPLLHSHTSHSITSARSCLYCRLDRSVGHQDATHRCSHMFVWITLFCCLDGDELTLSCLEGGHEECCIREGPAQEWI